MDHARQPNAITPWSHLRNLLREGPDTLRHIAVDASRLADIIDETHRLWKAMVDAFDGMIYICSMDYRIEFLNKRMIQHLGYDATGQYCYKAFGRREACPWCINHRVLKGEILRWEIISPIDGRWYDVVNAPLAHKDGSVSKYALMLDIHDRKENARELKKHRDNLEEIIRTRTAELTAINAQLRLEVDERKHAEEALRRNEAKYRELVENAASLIMRFDTAGRFTFFNEFAQQFFGYTPDEILGQTIGDTILPLTDSLGRNIQTVVDNFLAHATENESEEIETIKKNGERAWVVWHIRPISDKTGKTLEYLCVGMDVTERKHYRIKIQTLTQALLKAQENERSRISRDLHDHIAQDLSSLKIRLQTFFSSQPLADGNQHQINDLVQILQRAISEVRNLAYNLRPPELDQLGLVRTLYMYCEDFAHSSHLKIDFIAAGTDHLNLSEDIQINLYRLLQEALHNIKNHARASGVTIRLVTSFPNLILRIIDDGKGFDVKRWQDRPHRKKHMGLNSMVERVNLLDGNIDIRSKPGKGTGIFITIPIKEQFDGR